MNAPLTNDEVRAILRLLDEPEPARADRLITHLAAQPRARLAPLEMALPAAPAHARRNVEAVFTRSRFQELAPDWTRLSVLRRVNLEEALVLVARTAGDLDAPLVRATLDDLAERVGRRLAGDRALDNGLEALGEVLFGEARLRAHHNPEDPATCHIHRVLEDGLGIPVSLCSVALLVGQRLDLPVFGIGTPGHFLGFYGDPTVPSGHYFDPLDGYRKLSRAEIEALIRAQGHEFDSRMLTPVNEREIVARTLRNLIGMYHRQGRPEMGERLLEWLRILIGA